MSAHTQQILPTWRKVQNFTAAPGELAQACLAEAHNDPKRAVALAGAYAHGTRLRATIAAVGTVILHTS